MAGGRDVCLLPSASPAPGQALSGLQAQLRWLVTGHVHLACVTAPLTPTRKLLRVSVSSPYKDTGRWMRAHTLQHDLPDLDDICQDPISK